jgi:hypothetical protein
MDVMRFVFSVLVAVVNASFLERFLCFAAVIKIKFFKA